MSDPYFDQTVLLLHGNGPNSSTYIIDDRHHTVAPTNATISTAQSVFNGSSISFNGAAKLTIPASSEWNLGSDYTIEFFARTSALPTAGSVCRLFMVGADSTASALAVSINEYGQLSCGVPNTGSTVVTSSTGVITTDAAFHYYAISVVAGVGRIFKNDTLVSSVTSGVTTQSISAADSLVIGYDTTTGFDSKYVGYLAAIRITKSVGRYTTAISAPTQNHWSDVALGSTSWNYAKALLPMRGVQNGTVLTDVCGGAINRVGSGVVTVTDKSIFLGSCAYNNGSASLLELTNANIAITTQNFTIRFSFIPGVVTGANRTIFCQGSLTTWYSLACYLDSSGKLVFYSNSSGSTVNSVRSGVLTVGVKYAVEIVRAPTTLKLFVNGTQADSVSFGSNANYNASSFLQIMGTNIYQAPVGTNYFTGHISDFVYIVGLAEHSTNFTPSAAPEQVFAPQNLSGIVLDEAGFAAARTVRSYLRSTGQLVDTTTSNGTTGAFSLKATSLAEHFVVAFDDAQNAMIYDRITPV